MRQLGHAIIGDVVKLDSFTSDWLQVKVHPIIFYRRYDSFLKGFKKIKGVYAALDLGEVVIIRFSEKDDVTAFHRLHHEYV